MSRRLGVLTLLLVLAGCAGVGSSSSPAVPTTAPVESPPAPDEPAAEVIPVEWDRHAESPGVELCPPDGPATARPAFAAGFDDTNRLRGGVVKHGVVANPQGELFRIDVNGQSEDHIQAYADAVLVCLDAQFTGVTAGDVRDGAWPDEPVPPEPFPATVEDLLIEISLLDFVDPDLGDPAAAAEEIAQRPVKEWPTPDDAHWDELANDYLIDFVIDPRIAAGTTHQYVERYATRVWVTLSALEGHVLGGLCRNSSVPFRKGEVGVNGSAPTTTTLTDVQLYRYRYDLAVRGIAASTYRVSGTYFWPGWFAGYWGPAPAGSAFYCVP